MKYKKVITLVSAAFLSFGSLFSNVPLAQAVTNFDSYTAEQQLFSLLNQDRAQNGLGPLTATAPLFNLARGGSWTPPGCPTVHGRSQDMIEHNYFSHQVPPCNSYVWPGISQYGVQYSNAGENIAWNNYDPSSSPTQANTAFMNSPEHKANILGNFNQVGIGAYMGNAFGYTNVIMYTEIFVNTTTPAQSLNPGTNLYPVLLNNSVSGNVEIYGLSRSSNYTQFVQHTATAFGAVTASDWQFMVGSYNRDGQPDLYGIHERNTGSGRVEVHILSASSGYTSWLLHAATALPAVPSGQFQFALGSFAGDGRSNLYAIKLNNSGSNRVEVHVLSETSNYSQWVLHTATAFGMVSPNDWQFLIGDRNGSGDLVGVDHTITGSGKTEVHILSRASGYKTFTLHSATALQYTSNSQWVYALGSLNNNGYQDLYAIEMNNTGSGKTELHVLSASSNYTGWIDHVATGLGTTTATQWQFSVN